MAYLLALDGATAVGLAVMCCVPTTLSSAVVITDQAGGSRIWALSFTIVMNILGVFVLPFTLGFLLGREGTGAGMEIQKAVLLARVLKTVILPMAAGSLLRVVTRIAPPRGSGYIPSACIILVVWTAMSENARFLASTPPGMILRAEVAVVLVHLILFLAAALTGSLLRADAPGIKAMAFSASQKTLPVALAAILILRDTVPSFQGMVGEATVVCVMFHVSQIVADSLVSGWWRTRAGSRAVPGGG